MKKYLSLLILLSISMAALAQGISDSEVLREAVAAKKSGASESDIAARLMQRGATMEQIQRLRSQYATQITRRGMDTTVDNAIGDARDRMRVNNEVADNGIVTHEGTLAPDYVPEVPSPSGRRVFGRNIFNNRALTFESPMNIATPQDYVLGPGDQLVIDVFGATQETHTLTVSPDGDVTVPGYGPIVVGGLSVASAQQRIRSRLGGYFTSSDIKTSLGQTRTITVNVMGEVRTPGTYTLSAFATVFHALYRAGGINGIGTLRNIKVFRQGRQISVVDVYEFILNGRLAGNVRLQDNDVVQVGPYESIVEIEGRVKRPMAYEMRSTESLATLLKYSGGFTGDAYRKLLRVQRTSEDLKSVYNVEEFDFADFRLDDGDVVTVDSVYDRYRDMVEVKGAVFRPGMYRLGGRVTGVRSLLETASGVTEEAMTARAVLRRMRANRTQEVLSIDLDGILNGTVADVPLQNEDVLFVPTLAEHQNLRTLTIDGEVVFPGTYEYAGNMTVGDLILQAGGLTDQASALKIDVSRRLRDAHARDAGMEIARTFSFELGDDYRSSGDGFTLEPYDIVQVRRSPVFQDPIRVSVDGEIAFRGSYTMEQKNQRLSDLVKAAGGIVEGAYVRGARLIRRMTADERARMQAIVRMARQSADGEDSIALSKIAMSDTYTVGIHLDEALANPGSTQDLELVDGDRLVVPRFNHTVRISGDVNAPNTVAFDDGKKYKHYVKQAGGFGNRAKKRHAYVVYQNGTIAMAREADIEPGCEIVVPSKAPRNEHAMSQWLGIGTSAASLATMFATVANLVK